MLYFYLSFPEKASVREKSFVLSFSPHSLLHPQGILSSFANGHTVFSLGNFHACVMSAVTLNEAQRP